MNVGRKAVLGVGALVGLLSLGTSAHALTSLTIDKCLASQVKIVGKGAAAYTGCYAKAASKGTPTDSVCIGKAAAKVGPALDKLESKKECLVEGTGATRTSQTASYTSNVDATVGHMAGKCDAAKTKLVGKYVAALTGCYSKAANKTGTVDSVCVSKAAGKLSAGIVKAEGGVDCSNTGQTATLTNAANAFADAQTCALDPANPGCPGGGTTPTPTATSTPGGPPLCGNGVNNPGEACDPSTAPNTWATCGADFTCTASCNCDCPSTVIFSGDATATESVLDTGWTGISHRAPIISKGDVTVQLNCAASSRPCGSCPVSGPVANPGAGAGKLDNQRCSNDSAVSCTANSTCTALANTCQGGNENAPCAVAACAAPGTCTGGTCVGGANNGQTCCTGAGVCRATGSCSFYFGSTLPLAAGGVTTCVSNQFAAPITGVANVETGEATTTAFLTARVYNGIAIDNPCPRCSDFGPFNDNVNGGTCDGGPRIGLSCDANGDIPARPDYGRTSLDCPPNPAGIIATLAIDLSNATDPVVKTLTTASPNCTSSAATGDKCLCDTCNNLNAQACDDNADCPDPAGPIGPFCGGRRCLGGPNVGAACTNNTECPSVVQGCGRPGQATAPSGCQDDTTVADRVMECADGDSDGEGICTVGPTDPNCTVASGHAQRGCSLDSDCGGAPGSCTSVPRGCFLTGGGTFQVSGQDDGTNTLIAAGMEDPPMNDVSHPTLGAVFCVGPTSAAAINNVAGLPGPARITIKGTAVGHP